MPSCRTCHRFAPMDRAAVSASLKRHEVGGLAWTLEHLPGMARAIERGMGRCPLHGLVQSEGSCEYHRTPLAARLARWFGRDREAEIMAAVEAGRASERRAAEVAAMERLAHPAPPAPCDWCGRVHERCRGCNVPTATCGVCPDCGHVVRLTETGWRCRGCAATGAGIPERPETFRDGLCQGCTQDIPEQAARKHPCPVCGVAAGQQCVEITQAGQVRTPRMAHAERRAGAGQL